MDVTTDCCVALSDRWKTLGKNKNKTAVCNLSIYSFVLISCGKFGSPYPGKATAAAGAALPNPFHVCSVESVSLL